VNGLLGLSYGCYIFDSKKKISVILYKQYFTHIVGRRTRAACWRGDEANTTFYGLVINTLQQLNIYYYCCCFLSSYSVFCLRFSFHLDYRFFQRLIRPLVKSLQFGRALTIFLVLFLVLHFIVTNFRDIFSCYIFSYYIFSW